MAEATNTSYIIWCWSLSPLCYLHKKRQLLKRQWHSNFNVIVDNGRLLVLLVLAHADASPYPLNAIIIYASWLFFTLPIKNFRHWVLLHHILGDSRSHFICNSQADRARYLTSFQIVFQHPLKANRGSMYQPERMPRLSSPSLRELEADV